MNRHPAATTTSMMGFRALSVRQPWADLIIAGHKLVENRTWKTSWRGPIVVHASKRPDPVGFAIVESVADQLTKQLGDPAIAKTLPPDLGENRGAYIGVVRLVDVHRANAGCCQGWGEPSVSHWVLSDPVRFAHSVPGAGQRGLYTAVPPTVEQLVHDLLQHGDQQAADASIASHHGTSSQLSAQQQDPHHRPRRQHQPWPTGTTRTETR